MDTIERSEVDHSTATYDGFISYSHAADDLLAPRLQSGLQRFAKPWWKRRALRMFRDESSLSANPHLWSSITQALDQSGWFVLLLSPDAAKSPWVNQEIEYWKEHKDPSRILPVLTDGTFEWNDGDISGTAVPEQLRGTFTEEPRWVDMRFARDETDLDLKDPRFADAIADIASALRGVPKDELASEEVRQHRRTIRTAWTGGALVGLLAIAAAVFGIQSAQNATEAERQSQLARAREFAASAIAVLEDDPELATLLALHAIDSSTTEDEPPAEVINALWRAGSANRLIAEWDYSGFWHSDLSPDARSFAYFDGPRELVLMDAADGEPIWTYEEQNTVDFFDFPAIGPDGRVALLIVDSTSFLNPFQTEEIDNIPARVVILDGETGEPIHTLLFEQCETIWHPEWSPDGRFLAVSSGGSCDRGEGPAWVDVFDTDSWDLVATLDLPEANIAVRPRFDDTGVLHVSSWHGPIESFEAETFETRTRSGATGFADVSPEGDTYLLAHSTTGTGGTAFSAYLADALSGETTDVLYNGLNPPRMPAVTITRDGRFGIIGTDGRYSFVYDLRTNRLVHRIPTSPLISAAYNPETGVLYTTGDEPGVRLWNLRDTPVGVEISGDLRGFLFADDDYRTLNSFVAGSHLVGMVTTESANTDSMATQFFDKATGEIVGEPVRGWAVEHALADGSFVLTDVGAVLLGNRLQGRLTTRAALWDPDTRELTELFACETQTDAITGNQTCIEEGEAPNYRVLVSPDGESVLAYGFALELGETIETGHFRAYDAASGELVASSESEEEPDSADPFAVQRFGGEVVWGDSWVYGGLKDSAVAHDLDTGEVLYRLERVVADVEASPNRRYVASVRNSLSVVVTDTSTWEEVATIETDNRVLGVAFNGDGSKLAISDLTSVRVFDTAAGSIVQQLGLPGVADVYWLDDEAVAVGTTAGTFGAISLSTEDFLASTRQRLRRSLTDQECELYRIVPCPSLEEMRNG
jgi:WD40 repeat protein